MRWSAVILCCGLALSSYERIVAQAPFGIHVVDSDTGRGVPLVKLRANGQDYHTDSNGYLAFNVPGQMNQNVSFAMSSYGYGGDSLALQTTSGSISQVPIERTQRAERIYRVTGKGIYQDTVALGLSAPISQPLLNANVKGQDSVQTTIYNGQIHWFWGDTLYDVGFGNFRVSGATSELPSAGGLPGSVGVDLTYYMTGSGSSKQMMPLAEPGPVWIDGLFTITDNGGTERMFSHYSRRNQTDPLGTQDEHGLALFSDRFEIFQRHQVYALDAPISATGHAFERTVGGLDYIYFAQSYPNIRVRKTWNDVNNLAEWEAYTPLMPNSRYDAANPPLELDAEGKPVFGWKKNTNPLTSEMLEQMVQNGFLDRDESPFRLRDFESGNDVFLHRSSVYWNDYRNSWVMIGNQFFGNSLLGEVWFAEASTPEGPWQNAVRVATHDNGSADYTLYNPKQQPFFAEDDGRIIYFEGTYSESFSGNPTPTPLYDYNQMMFRLDLATIPPLFDRLVGDYNYDGRVDALDYVVWRNTLGSQVDMSANGDNSGASFGVIGEADFAAWKANYGATAGEGGSGLTAIVPEPATGSILFAAIVMLASRSCRSKRKS